MSYAQLPRLWDSLDKEEIRCQVRWRPGHKSGARDKGEGRGELKKRVSKV